MGPVLREAASEAHAWCRQQRRAWQLGSGRQRRQRRCPGVTTAARLMEQMCGVRNLRLQARSAQHQQALRALPAALAVPAAARTRAGALPPAGRQWRRGPTRKAAKEIRQGATRRAPRRIATPSAAAVGPAGLAGRPRRQRQRQRWRQRGASWVDPPQQAGAGGLSCRPRRILQATQPSAP